MKTSTIVVRTPNKPGYTGRVNREKYEAMRNVVLQIVPRKGPGITQAEMMAAVEKKAPKAAFPAKTSMWWAKNVQLDLEARGTLARDNGKPLRWKRAR